MKPGLSARTRDKPDKPYVSPCSSIIKSRVRGLNHDTLQASLACLPYQVSDRLALASRL